MLGEKLRYLRKKESLSQEEVAEQLNVSRQTISKYENEDAAPDIKKLGEIAKLFDVSYDYLLGEEKEKETRKNIQSSNQTLTIKNTLTKALGNYYKFKTSKVYKPKSNQPYGSLSGVYKETFWGESLDVLAYYATEKDMDKELNGLFAALSEGKVTYELQYYTKVDKKMTIIS